jgi:hypothetical protein
MKKLFLSIIGFALVTTYLVACGNNKSSSVDAVNPYAVNNGCPTGTYYSGGFCYNQNGQQWNGYNNGFTSSINFISDNFSYKNITITNGAVYKSFIKKAMGTCDRADNSGGIYSCDSWVQGQFQLTVQVAQTQTQSLRATFAAYPATNSNYWYGYSLPSASDFFYGMFGFPVYYDVGVIKNPLPLDMVVSVINDSKGFEARAYGDQYTAANRSLIQLQVYNGKLEDAAFDYQLGFEGQVFAKGRLQKY